MAIEYAGGTIVDYTFVSDTTRRKLVDELAGRLAAAGWSYVSGEGTADVLMQSATTPQGLFIRFRIYDPGSGSCAQVTMKNNGSPSALTSAIAYLLPTNSKTFRIIANKYQFFMFSSSATYRRTAREIVMGGVPFTWGFIVTWLGAYLQCGWMLYTGLSDADTAAHSTFRDRVSTSYLAEAPYASSLLNNVMLNYDYNATTWPQLCILLGLSSTSLYGYRYLDDSVPINEALISWSSTAGNTGERKIVGMLWDALVRNGQAAGESTISFDGHTFKAITDQATDWQSTLYVAVD